MQSSSQKLQSADEIQALRQQAGKWLRTLREQAGLSQRDLAKAVGLEYYTFISQLEAGRGRVPPAQYHGFAQALGIPVRDFVYGLMRYYDPLTFEILFEDGAGEAGMGSSNDNSSVVELAARVARLETLLESQAK